MDAEYPSSKVVEAVAFSRGACLCVFMPGQHRVPLGLLEHGPGEQNPEATRGKGEDRRIDHPWQCVTVTQGPTLSFWERTLEEHGCVVQTCGRPAATLAVKAKTLGLSVG